MASAVPSLLLDLAWAVVTVQLMIISFWRSSEHFRQRMYGSKNSPTSLAPSSSSDDAVVVLKKRKRLLQPKSVWDTEQVAGRLRLCTHRAISFF
jgi:hypothetical protein